MSDPLLHHYNRELDYLRGAGAEFAQEHQHVAGGMLFDENDPHVERMIMAFAYLSARVRRKIDDSFPELSSGLLDLLYPHYLAPVPSMSIVEFELSRGQSKLVEGYTVERGAAIDTEAVDGETCEFRTSFPVGLWPVEVAGVTYSRVPVDAPLAPPDAVSALRVELKSYSDKIPLSVLEMPQLRFFLNAPLNHAQALYELLFSATSDVVIAGDASAGDASDAGGGAVLRSLGSESIEPVGFDRDEAILPTPTRSHPAYRLLSEYFNFPQKFLFCDVALGGHDSSGVPAALSGLGQEASLYFYFTREFPELENVISDASVRLGCTPIVNLFSQTADPVTHDHVQAEHRVVPNHRRVRAIEIYSIDEVVGVNRDGTRHEYQPLYSNRHAGGVGERELYWTAARRGAQSREHRVDHGTEMFLSLVDPQLDPTEATGETVQVKTTCLNRDLPQKLQFGPGRPRLSLDRHKAVSSISCHVKPTATRRPSVGRDNAWRLVSHLSLNHLSLEGVDGSPDALREVLRLYQVNELVESRLRIDSLVDVRVEPDVAYVTDAVFSGVARGRKVIVTIDEERCSDNGMFLFASVLSSFLSMYCSVNSFTRTVVRSKQRNAWEHQWKPRAGERVLL